MIETAAELEIAIRSAPKLYVSNFGISNKLWPNCLQNDRIETFSHISALSYLQAADKDGYVVNAMKNELTAKGTRPDKGVAAKWYNVSKIFETSAGDLWLHRADDDIWWTISLPEPHQISYHPSHAPEAKEGDQVFHTSKATLPWRRHDLRGKRLSWKAAHPKARDFLATEATMQALGPEYEGYARKMILGEDLSFWHKQSKWSTALEQSGKALPSLASEIEKAAYTMALTAEGTAKNSNGQVVEQVVKNKELRFPSMEALKNYVVSLLEKQSGKCAVTGLPLQYYGSHTDSAMLCSLDRVDSDGHYEVGNLQVVCRFINFWKSDEKDAEFRRLVGIVRSLTP